MRSSSVPALAFVLGVLLVGALLVLPQLLALLSVARDISTATGQ